MAHCASNSLCLECGMCCNGVIFADVQLRPGDDPERLQSLGLTLFSIERNPAPFSGKRLNKLSRTTFPGSRPAKCGSALALLPSHFSQPCSALEGCRCRIYADRPAYCREFDCLLLRKVQAGKIDRAAATLVIAEARRRANEVKRLLCAMGDSADKEPLHARFLRVQQGMETRAADAKSAGVFGQLTLAVHELNLILCQSFYSHEEGTAGCGP